MFIFFKLVLAHYIADFILQFEELYRLKLKSRLGHVSHALIHAAVSLTLTAPYLHNVSVWIFIAAISTIHYFQDRFKYDYQARHPKTAFYCFTLDQVFHFLFISTVFFLPVSRVELNIPSFPALNYFYEGSTFTIIAIAFINAIFKGAYFLYSFRQTFIPGSRPDHFITSSEIAYAFWERGFLTAVFLFPPPVFFILAPLAGVPRLLIAPLKNKMDFLMSFAFSAAAALIFRKGLYG